MVIIFIAAYISVTSSRRGYLLYHRTRFG